MTENINITDENFEAMLCRIISDCCHLYKRNSPEDYAYTQAVVIMTLCELNFQGVHMPQVYRDIVNEFKKDLELEGTKDINNTKLPDNESDLKKLLLSLRDSAFLKA